MLLRTTTSRLLVPLTVGLLTATLPAPSAGAAGPWRPPVTLGTINGTGNGSAAVGLDSAGNALAVWDGEGVSYVARRPAGADWSAPTLLEGELADAGPVALRDDGTAIVAVTRPGDYEDYRGLAVLTPDNTVNDVSPGYVGTGSFPLVDQSDQGLLGVVLGTDPGQNRISYAADGDEPGSWRSTYALPGRVEDVTVTMSKGDSYLVASRPHTDGKDYDRIQLRSVDGLTGAARSLYDKHLSGTIRYFDVGSDSGGNALLSWVAKVGTKFALKAVRISPNGHVGPTVTIARRSTGPSGRMSPPIVVPGPGGAQQVVWSEPLTAKRLRLVVASSASGTSWSARKVLDGSIAAERPSLVRLAAKSEDTGAVLISYVDDDGTTVVRRAPGSSYDAPQRLYRHFSYVTPGLAALSGLSRTGAAEVLSVVDGVRARAHR